MNKVPKLSSVKNTYSREVYEVATFLDSELSKIDSWDTSSKFLRGVELSCKYLVCQFIN